MAADKRVRHNRERRAKKRPRAPVRASVFVGRMAKPGRFCSVLVYSGHVRDPTQAAAFPPPISAKLRPLRRPTTQPPRVIVRSGLRLTLFKMDFLAVPDCERTSRRKSGARTHAHRRRNSSKRGVLPRFLSPSSDRGKEHVARVFLVAGPTISSHHRKQFVTRVQRGRNERHPPSPKKN